MSHAYLLYVVGRSGVGKDTVLDRLRNIEGCTVAHRYITRAASAGCENHIALTEPEFQLRKSLGTFLLDWQAHGHCYGIGVEVKQWLECGLSVFVNGSRHHLDQAKQRLGEQMISVLIDADDDVCHQRLLARGRETVSDIQMRMTREAVSHSQFDWVIDNSGALETTVASVRSLLTQVNRLGGRSE